MGTLNQLTLVGVLGADPVLLKPTHPEGRHCCRLMVATHDQGEGGEECTTWHRVTCWGDQAIAAGEHLRKGSQVCVVGKLTYRVFRVGTQRRWAANVSASRVVFMERGSGVAPPLPDDAVTDPSE